MRFKGILLSLFCLGLVGQVATAAAWSVESGFECLPNQTLTATPIKFTANEVTFTIKEHYDGLLSVVDGLITPGEPLCLSDEEPGVLIQFSKPITQFAVDVVQLDPNVPVEVFYTLEYYRYGTAYAYEHPAPGADGSYGYAYAPNRITSVRIKNGALDYMRIDNWGSAPYVTELQKAEPLFKELATHADRKAALLLPVKPGCTE